MAIGVQSGLAIGLGGKAVKYSFGAFPYTFGSDTSTQQEAAQARDDYAAENPDWLLNYDNNENNVIQLLFVDLSGIPIREIQNRNVNTWVDVINSTLTPDEFGKHNIQDLKNVHGLATGSVLRAIPDGDTQWTKEAMFSESSSSSILGSQHGVVDALNIMPSAYTSIESDNGIDVLQVDMSLIDTEITSLQDDDIILGDRKILHSESGSTSISASDSIMSIEASSEVVMDVGDAQIKFTPDASYFDGGDVTDVGYIGLSNESSVAEINSMHHSNQSIAFNDDGSLTMNYNDSLTLVGSGSKKIDVSSTEVDNVTSIGIDNTGTTSIHSKHNESQSINFFNDGALSLGVESGKPVDIGFGGSVKQSFQSNKLDMGDTQVKNMKNATDQQDATTLNDVESYVASKLEDIALPESAGEGQLINDSVTSDGYGKNRTITYFGLTDGLVTNMDTDYGLVWGVHAKTGTKEVRIMMHEDFIAQKVDTAPEVLSSLNNLGIVIDLGEAALGMASQVANYGGKWDYSGRLIADSKDPNSTANSDYIDKDGNPCDRDSARRATYSAGSFRNVNDHILARGYVSYDTSTKESEFVFDSTSPWFITTAYIGGGSFSENKLFLVFQVDAHDQDSIQVYYDSYADIIGSSIDSNTNTIDELGNRVSALEDVDVVEEYLDTINEIVSKPNLFKRGCLFNHDTLRGSMGHGFDISGHIDSDEGFRFNGVDIGSPTHLAFTADDDVNTIFDLGQPLTVEQLDIFLRVNTPTTSSYIRLGLIKKGSEFIVETGRVEGEELTYIDFEYSDSFSASNGSHTLRMVGAGSGEELNVNVRTERTYNL